LAAATRKRSSFSAPEADSAPRARLLLAAALALATAAVYARTAGFSFTGLDDQIYVSSNHRVLDGLSARGIAWAFRTFYAANWHPLTWISLMLDAEIGGASPAVYHATNVVLHMCNTLLLFHAFTRLTGKAARSAFAAGLFALHPLHVESVAWIAERKDVLSTAFLLLGILAYLRALERPSWTRSAWLCATFAAGLLAKPMLVSFPILLLLLDVWPLRRQALDGTAAGRATLLARMREKLPLIGMSAASCVVTVIAQHRGGAIQSFEIYPLWARLSNAVLSYAVYLWKTVWPAGLSILYPHPGREISPLAVLAAAVVLAGLASLAVKCRQSRPYVPFGLLWYFVTLLPTIGLVQVGEQARADRYTYVPLIGIFVLVAWLVPDLAGERPALRRALPAAAAIVLAVLGAVAWVQAGHWRNRVTLFAHINAVIPDYPLAQNALGVVLFDQGQVEEAEKHFRAALKSQPGHAGAHSNLAMCLLKLERVEEGLTHLDEAIRLDPKLAQAYRNRGRAFLVLGRMDEALRDYARAVELLPDSAVAQTGYAEALVETGDARKAEGHAREALRIAPGYAAASNVLGIALLLQGKLDEATVEFRRATDRAPDFADAHANLAGCLVQQGQLDEAVEHARDALRLAPAHVGAHTNLGLARMRQGRNDEARAEFREVLRLRPGDARATRYLQDLGGLP